MTTATITEVKQCKEDGCTQPRYRNHGLCSAHKSEKHRLWRAANPESVRQHNTQYFAKHEGDTYLHTSGYVQYLGFDHPACAPGGITPHHRLIMWDKVDGQSVPCAECGGTLRWDVPFSDPAFLCVDHINEIKDDNRPENLDPVHNACNRKRAGLNAAKRKAAEEELTA